MDPWSMATAPLVAARCPCGHPTPEAHPLAQGDYPLGPGGAPPPLGDRGRRGLPRLSDITALGHARCTTLGCRYLLLLGYLLLIRCTTLD